MRRGQQPRPDYPYQCFWGVERSLAQRCKLPEDLVALATSSTGLRHPVAGRLIGGKSPGTIAMVALILAVLRRG